MHGPQPRHGRFEHEADDRRRASRLNAPEIILKLASWTYRTTNWSLGGALIDDDEGTLSAGALVDVTEIARPGDRRMQPVRIRARVARSEGNGRRLAIQFLEIDRAAYDFFRRIEGRSDVRGPAPAPVIAPAAARHVHPALDDMHRWPARRAPGAVSKTAG